MRDLPLAAASRRLRGLPRPRLPHQAACSGPTPKLHTEPVTGGRCHIEGCRSPAVMLAKPIAPYVWTGALPVKEVLWRPSRRRLVLCRHHFDNLIT